MDSVPVALLVFAAVTTTLAVVVTGLIYYLAAREWEDPRVACYWENVGCMYFSFVIVLAAVVALFLVFFLTRPRGGYSVLPTQRSTFGSPSSVSKSTPPASAA